MATRISPPMFWNGKNYERYKQELLAWREITDLDREKQAIVVALTLPENDESQIREKVFDQLGLDELKSHDGFNFLISFLDKHLAKDDLTDSLDKFEDFEDFKRADGQSINEFVAMFYSMYRKIEKKNMKLPAEILAFKLLRKANISKDERLLVLTGMNYENKKTLYEEAKKSLKKFKGSEIKSLNKQETIKLEPAFCAANEETLLATGYSKTWDGYRCNYRSDRGRVWNQGSPEKYNVREKQGGQFVKDKRGLVKPINPMGPDGRPLTCKSCGSFRHLLPVCPDSWENMKRVHTVEEEHAVLFTRYDTNEIRRLGDDTKNCAVLDSACSSTVCGSTWMDNYIESLDFTERVKVMQSEGQRLFKFGGGTCLKSKGEFRIPAIVAGKKVTIKTDVVDSDIPLLLSRTAMKKAAIQMNLQNDTAIIMGQEVALNITTSGHYCIPIDKTVDVQVEANAVDHENLNTQDVKVLKLSNIPNNMDETFIDLQGSTRSEKFEKGLNPVHATQRGIMRPAADEKVFVNKVRVSEQAFVQRDHVNHKKEGTGHWFGTRKVVFQEGNELFKPHEPLLVGVSPKILQLVKQFSESRDGIVRKERSSYAKGVSALHETNSMDIMLKNNNINKNVLDAMYNELKMIQDLITYKMSKDVCQNSLLTQWLIVIATQNEKTKLGNVVREMGVLLRALHAYASTNKLNVRAIDIKSAEPCKEIKSDIFIRWRIKCEKVEGLVKEFSRTLYVTDGARQLCLGVKDKIVRLACHKMELAVFLMSTNRKLRGIICGQVDLIILARQKSRELFLYQSGYRASIKRHTSDKNTDAKLKQTIVGYLSRTVQSMNKLKDVRSSFDFPRYNSQIISGWRVLVFSGTDAIKITQKCCPFDKHGNKIEMVAWLTLDAKSLSVLEGIICSDDRQNREDSMRLQRMLTSHVDNKRVIDIVHLTKIVDEKCLWVVIAANSESLSRKAEKEIRRCAGRSDCVTKQRASAYNLLEVFHGERCSE